MVRPSEIVFKHAAIAIHDESNRPLIEKATGWESFRVVTYQIRVRAAAKLAHRAMWVCHSGPVKFLLSALYTRRVSKGTTTNPAKTSTLSRIPDSPIMFGSNDTSIKDAKINQLAFSTRARFFVVVRLVSNIC